MSLKITLEVDGQSEQQLAPVLGQLVEGYRLMPQPEPQQNTQPASSHLFHENPSLLREQIQQLTAQNDLLEVQLANRQKRLAGCLPAPVLPPGTSSQSGATDTGRWPSGYPKQSVSTSAQNSAGQAHSTRVEIVSGPPLPTQYRPTQRAVVLHRLNRSTHDIARRLWQLLVRLSFGQEWVVWLLLLCAGLYGSFRLADEIAARLPSRSAEPVKSVEPAESIDGAPGESLEGSSEDRSVTDQAPEAVKKSASPPSSPGSKAGSHPPPPPAFQ